MIRILVWFFVFCLSIYSLVAPDIRVLGVALLLSFIGAGLDWVKQRRNR